MICYSLPKSLWIIPFSVDRLEDPATPRLVHRPREVAVTGRQQPEHLWPGGAVALVGEKVEGLLQGGVDAGRLPADPVDHLVRALGAGAPRQCLRLAGVEVPVDLG